MAESIPITKYKDLGGLNTKIPQFRRKAASKRLLVKGFDTETNKGDIFLIADSDGNYLDDISPKTVLDFLYHKRNHNSWNFFYHIGYDAEVICKLFGKNLFSYKETGKTNVLKSASSITHSSKITNKQKSDNPLYHIIELRHALNCSQILGAAQFYVQRPHIFKRKQKINIRNGYGPKCDLF